MDDGNGEPPEIFTRGDDRGGEVAARWTVDFAEPFGATGFVAGGCCIRITLRAVSSASSSAGSVGFDTFAGRRVCLEADSLPCAIEREISTCVARLPKRSCNVWAGDRGFSAALR